jgi:hypothetical protein
VTDPRFSSPLERAWQWLRPPEGAQGEPRPQFALTRFLILRLFGMNASFDRLRLVNTYGAFGSVGRERNEIVFEATRDEVLGPDTRWQAYEFKCKPGDPARRPCWMSSLPSRLADLVRGDGRAGAIPVSGPLRRQAAAGVIHARWVCWRGRHSVRSHRATCGRFSIGTSWRRSEAA